MYKHVSYLWDDAKVAALAGNEVDLLIDNGNQILPVEIKSGQTITNQFFKGLLYWNKITESTGGTLIYAGTENQMRSHEMRVVPYGEM